MHKIFKIWLLLLVRSEWDRRLIGGGSQERFLFQKDFILKGEMSMLINGRDRASGKERLKMKTLTKKGQTFKRSLG